MNHPMTSQSGRWFRRGGNIVIDLGGAPARRRGTEGEISEEISSRNQVIDSRIDVHAQYALLRMSKNSGLAENASGMLAAVKNGQIGGIYKEDQLVPAQLAKRNGMGWWELVPTGENAALVFDGTNQAAPPIIVFRNSVRSNASQLDSALVRAIKGQSQVIPSLIEVARQLGINPSAAEGRAFAAGKPVSLAARPAEFHQAKARAQALSASALQGEIGNPQCGLCQGDCYFLFTLPFFGNPVCICFGAPPFYVAQFCVVHDLP